MHKAILPTLSTILLATTGMAQNLLANPSFEGGLTGWSVSGRGRSTVEAANPPAVTPRTGNHLLKMSPANGGFAGSEVFQSFPARPGNRFAMQCWTRHYSGDPLIGQPIFDNWVNMNIAFLDGNNNQISNTVRTALAGYYSQDVWHNSGQLSATAPAGTVSVRAVLWFVQPSNAGGAAQFDDVKFTGSLAVATSFGSGCSGSNGVPTIATNNVPALGTTYTIGATNQALASSLGVMLTGSDNTTSPFGPLPFDLSTVGFGTGCFMLVRPDVFTPFGVAAGSGSWSLNIPNNPVFVGAELYHQAASIDGAAPGGLAMSNGVASVVGF